jgi:hypothetical protein
MVSSYKALCDLGITNNSKFRRWALKNHPDKLNFKNKEEEEAQIHKFSTISNLASEHFPNWYTDIQCDIDADPDPKNVFYPNPNLSVNSKKAQCFRNVENWVKIQRHHRFDKNTFDPKLFLTDMYTASPKMVELIKNIRHLDSNDMKKDGKRYKHFIFSDVKKGGYGAKIIASAFVASGFSHCFTPSLKVIQPKSNKDNETFGVLSSTAIYNTTFTQKHVKSILKMYNSREDNINGDIIRFIILDSGFKEGVDLFDVKYVHIFENQKTDADFVQAVGRATRSCGQNGLNFIPNIGWKLHVYQYYLTYKDEYPVYNDYLAYAGVDFNKFKISNCIEKMAILSAVDYDLNIEINKYKTKVEKEILTLTNNQTGGFVNKGCDESGKCGKRSTKTVPFSLEIMLLAYNQIFGAKPKGYNKLLSKDKRIIFCDALKANQSYCNLVNEIYNTTGNKKVCTKKTKNGKTIWSCKQVSDSFTEKSIDDPNTFMITYEEQEKPVDQNIENIIDKMKRLNIEDIKEDLKNAEDMDFDEFMKFINRIYKEYKYKPVKIENLCNVNNDNSKFVTFTESQSFVTNYFTPQHFAKGLLIWHSVGTGKTCTAISVKSFLFERMNYSVIWVTRNTLKEDIWKNMYDKICDHIIKEKYKDSDTAQTLRKHLSKRFFPPMSYRQFSNLLEGKNELYNKLVGFNGKEDILKNTLIIIDEAHKLYSKDLVGLERPNMNIIEKKINDSSSCKVMLMTGTPIADDPMELIKLLNLVIKKDKLPTNIDEFQKQYLENNNFTQNGKKRFQLKIKGLISYLNRRFDPRQFTQPVFYQKQVELSYDIMPIVCETSNENRLKNCDEFFKNYKSRIIDPLEEHTPYIRSLMKYNDSITNIKTLSQKIEDITIEIDNLKDELKISKKNKNSDIDSIKSLIESKTTKKKNLQTEMKTEKKSSTLYESNQLKSYNQCKSESKQYFNLCKKHRIKQEEKFQDTMFKKC